MHHLDSWIKIDQLDVTCFIISLFTAQNVSNVSTLVCRLKHCFSLHKDTTPSQPNHTVTPTHIEPRQYNTWNKSTISRKLLKMDVLTFEICWAVNSEIIKQVTSSRSIFIQLWEGKIYIYFYIYQRRCYILSVNDLCVNVYCLKMAVCNGRNMLKLPLYLN